MIKSEEMKSWSNKLLWKKDAGYYLLYLFALPVWFALVFFIHCIFSVGQGVYEKAFFFCISSYFIYSTYLSIECIYFARRFIKEVNYENGVLNAKTFNGSELLLSHGIKIEVLTTKFRSAPVQQWLADSTNWLIHVDGKKYYLSGKMENITSLLNIIRSHDDSGGRPTS